MKLYGVEVPEHLIDHALAQMEIHRGFDCADLEVALSRAGVPSEVVNRCADRTLQKLRKKGVIFYDGRLWKVKPKAA
jgi:hypothetical protein